MDKKLMKRLIALVLTGGILISSTGVYTALAASEEYTTSEYTSALVGSDETATTEQETTDVPSTSEPETSGTTEAETTTEKETEAESTTAVVQKPETTTPPETTTKPPIIVDEVLDDLSDNKAFQWLGIDGTSKNAGSQSNPYAVSSVEHFLAMNDIINDTGNANKYFKLTADIDFSATTIDSTVLADQSDSGMTGSLVSVDPALSSSSVFFHLDGGGKKLMNITIDNNEYATLSVFGYLNASSVITNLTITDTSVINGYSDAQAAGIILKNEGNIKDCDFREIVIDTTKSTTKAESFYPTDDASLRVYSGTAIVVDNSGEIDGEKNYDLDAILVHAEIVTIKTSRPYAGVLVAQNRGRINKIRSRYFAVAGDLSKSDYVGGLVGANMTARTNSFSGIYYCEILKDERTTAPDTVTRTGVSGADKIGYLVGYNTGRIQRCAVEGKFKSNQKASSTAYDIIIKGGKTAGAIAGENNGDVQLCTALNVGAYFSDVAGNTIYGGIVGKSTYGIRNCIATGSTANNGTNQDVVRYIGGIVGYGDTGPNFSVENCYALVKIIDSKVPLGAIVGFNGDEAYRNDKIKNVFYSSIISSRPSPVSYGGAGEAEGDLVINKPYAIAYYSTAVGLAKNTVEADVSDFSISGWGSATFNANGTFAGTTNSSYYALAGLGSSSITYELKKEGGHDKTVLTYGVDITLPSNVGAFNKATTLEKEPMEFGILNSSSYEAKGSGTKNDPFEIFNVDINFLYYAPAAHFRVNTLASAWSMNQYTAPSATFWGTIDFMNISLAGEIETPLFKGIYGSRDDSLTNNKPETNKSSSDDNSDKASNLANGVVKNLNFEIGVENISAVFGNICNATVKNIKMTVAASVSVLKATQADSGLFAKAVYGNSYIYGCYIDSPQSKAYRTNGYDGVAGFVGTIDADKALIDNCGVNLVIGATQSNAKNCALFVGNIKSLDGGYIQNCYVAGGLIQSGGSIDSSNSYLFAGSIQSSSTQIYNCFFSPSYLYAHASEKGVTSGIRAGSFTGSCKAWSFTEESAITGKWGDITMKVSETGGTTYLASLDNFDRYNTAAFAASQLNLSSYFDAVSSNEAMLSLDGNMMWRNNRASVDYTFAGASGASATLTVTHKETGLAARLTVFNSSALGTDAEGYYLIKTPADLYYLSTNQTKLKPNSADEYMYTGSDAKIKLDADIDMSGHSIEPIGSFTRYFQGTFVANKGKDGQYYKISNLTFNSDNTDHALFGNVQGATIIGVHLDNASIDGASDTAALVGTAHNSVTIEDCKVTNSNISGENHVSAILGAVRHYDDPKDPSNKVTIKNCVVEKTTIVSKKAEGDFAYVAAIAGATGIDSTSAKYAEITGCIVKDCDISSAAYGIGGIAAYAPNGQNKITDCKVIETKITCTGTNGPARASLAGIAAAFGGTSISGCTVSDSEITGECAAGIATRLINENGVTSEISKCTVTKSNITSETTAAGILSHVGVYSGNSCYGDKLITDCKVSADTTVKAAVAAGIVGNIQQFSGRNLTVSGCTNLGTIETTGKKGSQTDGAGGIIGRISTGMETTGILVTSCLSQGTLKGNSNLGGIIAVNSANAHSGGSKLIKDCYVTADFSSKNLAVVKGLIIGYVGLLNKSNISALSENVVYSSLDTRVPLYGNVEATAKSAGAFDMNLGADQTSGITIGLPALGDYGYDADWDGLPDITTLDGWRAEDVYPYWLNAIVGYQDDGTLGTKNVIELKTNFYEYSSEFDGYNESFSVFYDGVEYFSDYSFVASSGFPELWGFAMPRFSVGNLPTLTGTDNNEFTVPTEDVFTTTASNSKIIVGAMDNDYFYPHNQIDDVSIQTFNKKCQAVVKTTYTGIINGEEVTFDVGFTVIVRGEHAFDGSGTQEDPFKIYEAEDLLSIKQHHDNPDEKDDFYTNPGYYYEAYYEVMNDIDMSEELIGNDSSFAPIGTLDEPFKGHIFSTPGNQFTISNMLIDSDKDYAYSTYYGGEEAVYSDALGVFGYTDGAEIVDLRFENVTIASNASSLNGFLGSRTGAVVGVAKANTSISNVTVTGTVDINITGSFGGRAGAVGGIVGEAEEAVVLTDVSLIGADSENKAKITGLYQVGGIIGTAADATGGSITNPVVENADIINAATSGVSIAGGIAGQYSGIITGTPEVVDSEGNVVDSEIRGIVNNVSVIGTVVGGVVGSGNINNLTTGGCHLTIKSVDVTNTDVEVTDTVRSDANAGPNGIAGGILGVTYQSYHYLIEDCTVSSDSSVTTGYCAGGILGKAQNRGVGSLQTETSLFIRDCSALAKVEQLNAATSKTLNLSDDTKRGTGVGSVIGVITTAAYTMNQDTMAPQIQITNVTAGGNISGTFNVGGIIGEFASVQANLHHMTDSIVHDCVVTAKLTALADSTERFGIILGSVEGNQYNDLNPNEQILNTQYPFPEADADGGIEYESKPFDKIFYSSYTAGEYNLYGLSSIKDYQDPVYSSFTSTVYDVNQVSYNFKSPSDGTLTKLPISVVKDGFIASDPTASYQWFGEQEYVFSDEFEELLAENEGSGTPFGFTIGGKDFILVEDGVQSANKNIFEVIPNPDREQGGAADRPYKITVKQFNTADLVFTYTNGLQIAIPVICGVNFDGEGTSDDPIKVENADIFYHIVKVLPSYSFVQTAEVIDLSDESKYPATEVAYLISNFTGTYDGQGNTITGFKINIESSETPVGIFGKVSGQKTDSAGNVIPNIKNLNIVNCTVNSGDTDQGTGVVAGAVTDGATISGVKVQNSSVTSAVGPVGGAVGTVSGTSSLDNIQVTDGTKVTATTGSAGGVVGTITDDTVVVNAPYVADTTVTSGGTVDAEGNFSGASSVDDIAGGIVAQSLGTIKGGRVDENGERLPDVERVTVNALVSGGAVGAVYETNLADSTVIERKLSLEGVRVSGTDVVAKTFDGTRNTSAAGLLGFARNTTNITLDNCYVDKTTETSTVASSGGVSYGAGAVANVNDKVISLKIIDTESYATVNGYESRNDGTAYVGGLVGYINNSPSILSINGSVAGGKITGKAVTVYAAGVIGGFDGRINEEIIAPLFVNGVISAEVHHEEGKTNLVGSAAKFTLCRGKFIARYGADMFKEENFETMFASGNYYSTYPQDIPFFATETGAKGEYDTYIKAYGCFKDINIAGNLVLSDESMSTWNSAAITKNIGSSTLLYAKFDEQFGLATIYYGSKTDTVTEKPYKPSSASGGFSLESTGDIPCIELENVNATSEEGVYEITVVPREYGAAKLVATYDCGLATTATIISVEIRGNGTEESPYLIGTPTELRVVGYLATGGNHFRQYQDIDLTDSYKQTADTTDGWINYNSGFGFAPIGTSTSPFDGVYDGQGYKISGLRMLRSDESDVGLFGTAEEKDGHTPYIKNVHLELMAPDASLSVANGIVGNKNVGGIVGNITNGIVENCSVAVGTVTGQNNVGGIVGNFTNTKVINCFTQSDVSAFGTKPDKGSVYAGGIVGYVNIADMNSEISGCFASGSIYATPLAANNDKSDAAGIVSYIANSSGITVENCLFTGTTAGGFGILAGAGSLGMVLTLENCIDAGQNVAMAPGDIFDNITNAVATTNLSGQITKGGLYYDSSLLKIDNSEGSAYVDEETGYIGKMTSELVSTNVMSDNASWTKLDNHYPVPVVSDIKVVTYTLEENDEGELKPDVSSAAVPDEASADSYSSAYAAFLSAPVQISETEECNDIKLEAYGKGLVYPVTLLTTVEKAEVTYSSSIFDTTDTEYPDNFDTNLYGVLSKDAEGNVVNNKCTDLLFEIEDVNGDGKTPVYRNIFDTTKSIAIKAGSEETNIKNTYVNKSAGAGIVFSNGEAYYNAQVPVIFATATIGGVEVQRDIKLPLSQGSTYCIATQRQLYALGGNESDGGANNKFSDYYNSGYNYKLITDIDCTSLKDENGNIIEFTPIGHGEDSGYTGQFDGSGHTIKGLTITSDGDYVGFFSKVSKDKNNNVDPFVKNLTLENTTVSGKSYVGTLIGHVYQSGVTIENCHAIGYAEYDDEGNIIEDTITGTVEGTGSYVGGLIGKVDYASDSITSCSSSVTVSGSKDAVGGLIGESGGTITSCYATGNVICDELTDKKICGVGGLIGIMSNGTVTQSFASGNVEVKAFNTDSRYNNVTEGEFGIGGFVGYVAEMFHEVSSAPIEGNVITECFSGGNVIFGTANDNSSVRPYSSTVNVGIGGFSGINHEKIAHAYSSAAVQANFGDIIDRNASAVYGVGVGGVAGVALEGISDVYSSGSVAPAYKSLTNNNGNSYYGVGGTIGTTSNSGAVCQYCYFDRWTNTDPDLTSIGGRNDDNDAKSLTTTDLTVYTAKKTRPSTGVWSSEVWGFTNGAYPYLKALLNENVDNSIKTNSILSVVCVNVEDDDVSAKTGAGLTQGLIVPMEFKYKTTDDQGNEKEVTYTLAWGNATTEGYIAAPTRTQNVQEYVDIVAQVEGLEIYATRIYSRLCADMKGTFEQPYLIGNENDLKHVNMTAAELEEARNNYSGFYDQWATPIVAGGTPIDVNGVEITPNNIDNKLCELDGNGNPVSGVVHYQLMSNVSAANVPHISGASESYGFEMIETDADGNESLRDINVQYRGFMFKGNGYAIKDVTTTGYFFSSINSYSTIANMIFDNFTFTGSSAAIAGTNEGTLQDVFVRSVMGEEGKAISDVAGLVNTNKGTIDGCVVDATIKGAESNVGVMAVKNSGTIRKSATAGTLDTAATAVNGIGAFVAENSSKIEDCFSMADVNVLAAANAAVHHISGFAAYNSGTIDGVYTRSAVSFANTPRATTTIASLVGEIVSVPENVTESVTNSYAAGLLGYFGEGQDSILFGKVPSDMAKLSSVYVDKSLAGQSSVNSFKYSTSLSSLMSMQYMPESMKYIADNPDTTVNEEYKGKFITGSVAELVLPQLAEILNAENDRVVDDEGNLIYVDTTTDVTYTLFTETDDDGNTVRKYRCSDGNIYFADEVENVVDAEGNVVVYFENLELQYSLLLEDRVVIRNYDVIKAYSKISSMLLKTSQSQYADRLVANSSATMINDTDNLNSKVSTATDVRFNPVSDEDIIGIINGTRQLYTNNKAGSESIRVNYANNIVLSRGVEINPQLLIDVAVTEEPVFNPNFGETGIGTKANPYVINTPESLMSLHYYGTESDLYFILGDDIDMDPEKVPGADDFQIHVFTAHLNDPESTGGNAAQHTIKNFTSTKGEGGLFGRVEEGAVINNVALTGKVIGDEQYTGALANRVNGATITNCVVAADVTSTFEANETSTPATGVLAGFVKDGAKISDIVTTGNVTATAGAVGGVIGSAQNAQMSEFVSTANVGALAGAAGIVGEMLEGTATLSNALYGGVAESKKPVVASYADAGVITKAYYDTQLNKSIEAGTVIGEGKTTSECEKVFAEDKANFTTFENGLYPVPVAVAKNIKGVEGYNSYNEVYGSVAALAAESMNFYLGSSRGEIGYYTSMQFATTASDSEITVTEEPAEGYFTIDVADSVYVVKTAKYNESKNPVIVLTLANGARRTIMPGLVRNANISYTITKSNDLNLDGKTLGVLFKSVSDKTNFDSVNVLNDFTTKVDEKVTVDALLISATVNGFYVGEMLPAGYKYQISAKLNGEAIPESDIATEENIYGTFIELPKGEGNEDIVTTVELTLTIVKADKPWGVNSIKNIL